MSAETIIAIVTAGIALITSALSFSYNMILNRKSRIQKVILENRIKYMYAIREGFSNFIGCATVEAITAAKNSSDVLKVFSNNFFIGYGNIKTYIKPFYRMDEELITALDKAYFAVLALLNTNDGNAEELKECRQDFELKYLTYDWAYWKYIQSQKDGNYKDSDKSFDDIYEEFIRGKEYSEFLKRKEDFFKNSL